MSQSMSQSMNQPARPPANAQTGPPVNQPLPFPLPYPANALEPVLSQRTVALHDSLAAGYMRQFPVVQSGVPAAVLSGEQALREQLRTLSFQGSGYVLHQVYFSNMTAPDIGGAPGPVTRQMIAQLYPSVPDFQKAFITAANAVEGATPSSAGCPPPHARSCCRARSTTTRRSGAPYRYWRWMCGNTRIYWTTARTARGIPPRGGGW